MRPAFKNLGRTKRLIIRELWRTHEKKRAELVENLKLARTTIYDNLAKGDNSLLKRGIVKKIKSNRDIEGRGRPNIFWTLTQEFIDEMEEDLKKKSNK
ncbi:MAG: hypothetical protein ACFFG0_42185 [Candidatus Thorarchaeota archaeon]